MTSLLIYGSNDNLNVSNVSLVSDYNRSVQTTEIISQIAVEESLRKTRFVVQEILTPIVVTIGLLGNVLNILVLFQPSMRTSTNVYLLFLSIADSIFLVFNFALSIFDCRKRGLHFTAYYFNPYGRFVSNVSGNIGVWVTVVFTVERYIAVCHPFHGKVWCTVKRAKTASFLVGILALINTIPTLFELEVVHTHEGLKCSPTEFATSVSYNTGYSWWYVFVFTFIPFVCLTIFNYILIRALLIASKKRQQLALISTTATKQNKLNGRSIKDQKHLHSADNVSITQISERSSTISTTGSLSVSRKQRQSKRKTREQNKVTIMLITIVMIFLLCQAPWTALYLYQTYISSDNITELKIAGNVCNLMQLVNASVNFYLYSSFSKQFRRTLARLVIFWSHKQSSPTTV